MADDSEEYGTVEWFWKYEPEASEVMFRAGFAAGREAERRDVVAWLRKRPGELRCVMTAGTAMLSAAHHVEAGEHVGAADKGTP